MKILENDLPLFPLQTVLFPQARLPLHIFEPRYRDMIDRCVRDDLGFGILLIKEGVEVGGPAVPHTVGTVSRVVDVSRLDDGRMNIVVAGVARFRLIDSLHEHAYLSGRIELFPDENANVSQVEPLAKQAVQLFQEYIRTIRAASDPETEEKPLQLPNDPTMCSYIIASAMPLTMLDKQSLLEAMTTRERLNREIVFLRRELELLRLIADRTERILDQGPFSLN